MARRTDSVRFQVNTTVTLKDGRKHTTFARSFQSRSVALSVATAYRSGDCKSSTLIGERHDEPTRTDQWFFAIDGRADRPVTLTVRPA